MGKEHRCLRKVIDSQAQLYTCPKLIHEVRCRLCKVALTFVHTLAPLDLLFICKIEGREYWDKGFFLFGVEERIFLDAVTRLACYSVHKVARADSAVER